MPITKISVRGARQHNLKNINVEIPRNTLTVITGLSGSGKSSLAFDTIYAEGQRRYVETLSAYARQFLDQMERPDVDAIDGLSPSISIEQKTTSRSPRSTVAASTESGASVESTASVEAPDSAAQRRRSNSRSTA
jgi:excinuclease ABC subunit A